MQQLCDKVCEILIEEGNITPVVSPVTVCGDIHGQVSSLNIETQTHRSGVYINLCLECMVAQL